MDEESEVNYRVSLRWSEGGWGEAEGILNSRWDVEVEGEHRKRVAWSLIDM